MQTGVALRDARKKAGLTQRQLAAATGVPQSAIARIEIGAVTPRVDTLEKLLRGCGYTLEIEKLRGRGLDRTTIREFLKLTPQQRIERSAEEANNLEELLSRARLS